MLLNKLETWKDLWQIRLLLSQSKRIIKTSDKRTSFKNHFLLNIKQTGRPLQGQRQQRAQ